MVVVIPGLSESLRAVDKRITKLDTTGTALSVEAARSTRRALCPRCSVPSSRRHGLYRCKLGAQPCMGHSVSLNVQVRRFKCVNPQCSQATFVEQIDVLGRAKLGLLRPRVLHPN
jgi:transposase